MFGNTIPGASFTGVTVNTKTVVSDRKPSVTNTVMFAWPFQSARGVNVRLFPSTLVVIAEVSE